MAEGITSGNVRGLWLVQFVFDAAAVSTVTTAEQTVTVPGLRPSDVVFINKPSLTAGVGIANARCSAADTLSITYVNPTAGSVNPASETYTALIVRASGSPVGAVSD